MKIEFSEEERDEIINVLEYIYGPESPDIITNYQTIWRIIKRLKHPEEKT